MALGVLFDMDGVLVDSGPAHSESWRVLARRYGLELSEETFRRTFGMPSRDIIRLIWGDNLSPEQIRRLDEEKEAVYRELIRGRVPVSPGADETLDALHSAGCVLAVGTSGPPENVDLVLQETGWGRFFAATVNGFDVVRGKPAPDVFLVAAERAGLSPAECIVVEDAPVGIAAGRAAGMPVVGYAGTHPPGRLQEAGADVVVARLPEITPSLVSGLLEKRNDYRA